MIGTEELEQLMVTWRDKDARIKRLNKQRFLATGVHLIICATVIALQLLSIIPFYIGVPTVCATAAATIYVNYDVNKKIANIIRE